MLWSIFIGVLIGFSIAAWIDRRYRRMLATKLGFLTDTYADGDVCYVFENQSWWRVRAWRLPMLRDDGDAVGDWPRMPGGPP